ncbi:FAD-linked oxidase [Halobacteriales archaeon QS_1_69_70]|nr:MAG: FAD-linked oxidase [Halobacteriales archaeon QS_1_69_70]
MTADDRVEEPVSGRLEHHINGGVLEPGDEGYDESRRVWNGMIDKFPAAIVRCTGTADVIAAVDYARENDRLLAIKGGGHNVAGKSTCDGGILIDLSLMNSVRVDPSSETARVGPGAKWADFDHEAQAFGLATTGGFISTTGVAGLTLGGGIGYLARKFGLSTDNLIGVDVVTADGEFVHASEAENPGLFWGLRGGGGNLGIVTCFNFELHGVGPEVLTAQVVHPIEDAEDALYFYKEFMADAPNEVACYATVAHVPEVPRFPEVLHGQIVVGLFACYAGPVDKGRPEFEPFADFGDPIFAAVHPMRYADLQQFFDGGQPRGERYYWKSHYLQSLPEGAIDTIASRTESLPGRYTQIVIEPMGGAINEVDETETAYPHRNAAYTFGVFSGWGDPNADDEMIAWTRNFHEEMSPYATGAVYSNYLDRDEEERISAAYGENYERLVELKEEWDPDNLFSLNQNVQPSS